MIFMEAEITNIGGGKATFTHIATLVKGPPLTNSITAIDVSAPNFTVDHFYELAPKARYRIRIEKM